MAGITQASEVSKPPLVTTDGQAGGVRVPVGVAVGVGVDVSVGGTTVTVPVAVGVKVGVGVGVGVGIKRSMMDRKQKLPCD